MLNGLDLFSGIGGISLALSEWVKPISYCESDRYAQSVLLSRMQEGKLPIAPIWDDVRTLSGSDVPGQVDIIFGGFPCQDISIAGNGKGLEGKRSGLFFQVTRLVKETKPRFVFLENVPAIEKRGLSVVIKSFSKMGYDCRWTTVSAASVSAPHKRERWFMLAHSNCYLDKGQRKRGNGLPKEVQGKHRPNDCSSRKSSGASVNEWGRAMRGYDETNRKNEWYKTEPKVGRMVDELPYLVDRIKCLGNSVVPIQAKAAFERLMGLK